MAIEDSAAAETVRQDLLSSDLFTVVPDSTLDECARRAQRVSFARGALIAREGDGADGFFILTSGSAEVFLERPGLPDRIVDTLLRGDCLGESALLLNQPRTASVRASRNCDALFLSREDFAWLLQRAPEFTLHLAKTVAARLVQTTHGRVQAPIQAIIVVAASPGVDIECFGSMLESALLAVSAHPHALALVSFSDNWEGRAADPDADAVLFVGDPRHAPATPRMGAVLDRLNDARCRAGVGLVLLHDRTGPLAGTGRWLSDRRIAMWHHVRRNDESSAMRMARRVLGQATALVLSGGGARGFAHIGVIKALEDANLPIDYVAGTSMGAIVAAQYAMGVAPAAMVELMRRAYLHRELPDFALPHVALNSGRAADRRLKAMFGNTRIENLPIPYFSVASDLCAAETVIHERGRLWWAARSSSSVPGLLPPLRFRGRLLVDGGLLDNLPVDAMRTRCRGRIVASDVSVAVEFSDLASRTRRSRLPAALRPRARLPGIGDILMRTAQLASVRDSRRAGSPADLYLNPSLQDVGMNDFARLEEIVERGADYARAHLAAWAT